MKGMVNSNESHLCGQIMNDKPNVSEPANENSTVPADLEIAIIGLEEGLAKSLNDAISELVVFFGTQFDLSGLDGITVASEYSKALLDLDRGYISSHRLTPSNTYGVGVAMSPSVIRNGVHKCHLLFDAMNFLEMLHAKQQGRVINLLAHECAHVEARQRFDSAFPGVLLKKQMDTLDSYRWDVILACWDEFTACWRSAQFGQIPCDEYEVIFLRALSDTRQKANASITSYRLHGDISRVVPEVTGAYGNLLKYSAYHLGHLEGKNLNWRQMPSTVDGLSGHWFQSVFEALEDALKELAETYGSWTSDALFLIIGDIAEELLVDGGMRFYRNDDGTVGVDIPMTPETTPT